MSIRNMRLLLSPQGKACRLLAACIGLLALVLIPSKVMAEEPGRVYATTTAEQEKAFALKEGWAFKQVDPKVFDPDKLQNFIREMREGTFGEQHSLLILHEGKIVWDELFKGYNQPEPDERKFNWRRGVPGRAKLHDFQSSTKSIASLLAGIAVDKGFITDLDAKLETFLPQYEKAILADPRRSKITLRHLLDMKAGFEWDDSVDGNLVLSEPDWVTYVLNKPMKVEPGKDFDYNSGASILIGKIIAEATGQSLGDFADEHLFHPLGINDLFWFGEDLGLAHTGGGLQLWPRDFGKLAQLVLNEGVWNGRQIVSKDWLSKSTFPQSDKAGDGLGYNHQWWLAKSRPGLTNYDITFTWGYGGQHAFIMRSHDLVVVMTAGNYRVAEQGIKAFMESFLPSLRTESD